MELALSGFISLEQQPLMPPIFMAQWKLVGDDQWHLNRTRLYSASCRLDK
jgi:hypothetical protein